MDDQYMRLFQVTNKAIREYRKKVQTRGTDMGGELCSFIRPPYPDALSPGDRYPVRRADAMPDDLVSWGPREILTALGIPHEIERGTYWYSHKQGATYIMAPDGEITEMAVFGPVPSKIPVGTPYVEWIFHNMIWKGWSVDAEPETCILYLLLRTNADKEEEVTVAEVYTYGTGAIF